MARALGAAAHGPSVSHRRRELVDSGCTDRERRMTRILAGLLGLYYVALGAVMLWDPLAWYKATPGVTHTGPFNPHFVIDVALAFVASGALWSAAAMLARHRAGLALGAALWPALHAAFHVFGWLGHGLPQGPALWAELLGVVLVAAIGTALAIHVLRSQIN